MPVEQWIDEIPKSRMEYPSAVLDQLKYWFWKVYTPLHPVLRHTCYQLGLNASLFVDSVDEKGRQNFLLGTLDPERPLRDFVDFLVSRGFGNHFISWKEKGECVSLRKTDGFNYQYHIRIFSDGEVRCHYEFTPEYRPLQHLLEVGFEDRALEFRALIQDWLAPTRDR